ncbi:hypothetical protein BB560_002216 [Smittium megazygosporum]|uniref:Uncharacterized protein n=1 Tax=Smittium megazygosporum TaxID=133381 RepID=A0A2T9ZFG8_9FUNG|nr:hypothetical protein BB560_002216 [Smittium megazygosporum]
MGRFGGLNKFKKISNIFQKQDNLDEDQEGVIEQGSQTEIEPDTDGEIDAGTQSDTGSSPKPKKKRISNIFRRQKGKGNEKPDAHSIGSLNEKKDKSEHMPSSSNKNSLETQESKHKRSRASKTRSRLLGEKPSIPEEELYIIPGNVQQDGLSKTKDDGLERSAEFAKTKKFMDSFEATKIEEEKKIELTPQEFKVTKKTSPALFRKTNKKRESGTQMLKQDKKVESLQEIVSQPSQQSAISSKAQNPENPIEPKILFKKTVGKNADMRKSNISAYVKGSASIEKADNADSRSEVHAVSPSSYNLKSFKEFSKSRSHLYSDKDENIANLNELIKKHDQSSKPVSFEEAKAKVARQKKKQKQEKLQSVLDIEDLEGNQIYDTDEDDYRDALTGDEENELDSTTKKTGTRKGNPKTSSRANFEEMYEKQRKTNNRISRKISASVNEIKLDPIKDNTDDQGEKETGFGLSSVRKIALGLRFLQVIFASAILGLVIASLCATSVQSTTKKAVSSVFYILVCCISIIFPLLFITGFRSVNSFKSGISKVKFILTIDAFISLAYILCITIISSRLDCPTSGPSGSDRFCKLFRAGIYVSIPTLGLFLASTVVDYLWLNAK